MIDISPLRFDDCQIVANAHIANLNSRFTGKHGEKILEYYYRAIVSQDGAVGYVAKFDGQFAGYVCGIWNPKAIQRHLLKYWPNLIFHTIPCSLKDLQLVRYGLKRLRHTCEKIFRDRYSLPKINNAEVKKKLYELRPIVVLPEFRGKGIADALVKCLLEDAQKRGFDQIYLLTENDNIPAIKFYIRFGFVFESTTELHPDTPYTTIGKIFRYYIKQ